MIRRLFITTALASAMLAGSPQAADKTLKMIPLDMDGGGGTLFVTPEGRSLLIDTGTETWIGAHGAPMADGLDGAKTGVDRILSAAKALGVKKIDYLIMTHYHGDHIGGVYGLLQRFPVDTIIDHGPNRETTPADGDPTSPSAGKTPKTVALYARYLEAIKGHRHIVAKPGEVFHFGSLTDTIVSSDGKTITRPLPGAGKLGAFCDTPPMAANGGIENAMSVGSILSFGKVRISALGDLTWNKEHDLACPVDKIGHVNILLVTHHGLDFSSNPAIIAAMRPDIAIMGNGPSHGAAPGAVKTIKASSGLQAFWRLHESLAYPDPDADPNYTANLGPSPSHGYTIRLDIARNGRVTVTNTRNGFSRIYKVD